MSVFGLHRPRIAYRIAPAGPMNKFRRQPFHLTLIQTTELFQGQYPLVYSMSKVYAPCPADPVPVEAQAERERLSDGRLLRLLPMSIQLRLFRFIYLGIAKIGGWHRVFPY